MRCAQKIRPLPRPIVSATKLIHRLLIRRPRTYAGLLRWLRRGAVEKRVFLRSIRRGDIVCDVGANRGNFTLLFSELVGPAGEVHAFEPGPDTFAMLESTMSGRSNCRLNRFALAETPGEAILLQPGRDDGQASLQRHREGSWSDAKIVHEHPCRVSTLDEYAKEFTRLHFMKVDVEGAELSVLRGARETLTRLSPVLFLEVHAAWTAAFDYTPANLCQWLHEAGYTEFILAGEKIERLKLDRPIDGPTNLLCAKRDALPHVLEA